MTDKKIIKDFERKGKRVEVFIKYNKGDWREQRGYYVHCQPYTSDGTFKTVVAFTGFKKLLLETTRKSERKMQEAILMVTDEMIEQMVSQCKFD